MKRPDAAIVLNDGSVFEGYAVGFLPDEGVTTGEFVFNTALSGYQEVLTDPSYAGQIISFTYPPHWELRNHSIGRRSSPALGQGHRDARVV